VALLVVGCHSHVQLQAPEPTAPEAERTAAYARLRPLAMHQTDYYRVGSFGQTSYAGTTTDYLQLAGGERVYYPEDVLPVVPAGSPSATAAQESADTRSTGNTVLGVGCGVMGLGVGVGFYPFFARDSGSSVDFTPVLVGIGLMLAGGVVALVGNVIRNSASDEAASAFLTYDDSLLQRLALCDAGGGRVAACGATPPAEATPLPGPPIVSPGPPIVSPGPACVPSCRDGFACVSGRCVSGCNPPCPPRQRCVGQGASFHCR
jgi:hypothetical protein